MQALTQDHSSSSAQRNSFLVSALVSVPEKLPAAQVITIPTAYALYARTLTQRESETLELLGTGLSIKGVARGLGISPGTVKWHVKNLYSKLGASSREDALFKARQWKLIR